MKSIGIGVLLAALNVLVIAIGLSLAIGDTDLHIALTVAILGMLPAVVLGAVLGWLADVTSPLPVWLRRVVLALPALLLVIVLAAEFALQAFILVSCIPTAVAALLLERATRLPPPRPPVPVAHVRRA